MIRPRSKSTSLDYGRAVPMFVSALNIDIQNKVDRTRKPINGYVEIKSISAGIGL